MIGDYLKGLDEAEEYLRSIGEYGLAAKVNAASWAMYEYWSELIRVVTSEQGDEHGE